MNVDGIVSYKKHASLRSLAIMDGIVHIFDSFEANNTAYIVMEYLDGETLEDHLQRVGTLPEEQALEMIVPILKTLDECTAMESFIRTSRRTIFSLCRGRRKIACQAN